MKVCVVGLDGATWDLLDPWLDDLPTIRAIANTYRTDLQSCVPPLSIPAWKVYSTGMDPGRLGVFTFVDPDFETERFKTVSSETFVHRELWDYLGAAGHESAVINMPGTSPPRDTPGWMVSGPFADTDDFARPTHFQSELADDDYVVLPDYYLSRNPADITRALETLNHRFEVALELSERVEFLHVTAFITDTVQHTEWDSAVCRELWQGVDQQLGQFIESLGPDWNVLLMSDHGFGPSKGHFYLNTWLQRNGYLSLDEAGVDFGDVAARLGLDYRTIYSLIRRLRLSGVLHTIFPSEVLLRVARQMPGNRKLEGTEEKLDWDSDAIALAPLVYTKSRGVADAIRDDLLSLVDADGDRVVDEVYYGADLYPDCSVRVPDLIIDHGRYVISDIFDSSTQFDYDREDIIAHHRRTGILAAAGPDIEGTDAEQVELCDLAPTIIDAFGGDIPHRMSGERIGLLGRRGKRRGVSAKRDVDRVIEHSETVEQTLEDLGYL